jgi:hypothetical protein
MIVKIPKKMNQHGFIPMILSILFIVLAVIYFAYLRVKHAHG